MTLAQLDEQIARIEFAKQNMYMALLEKGVSVSAEDSIEMYANYIRSIGPGPVPVEDTPLLWIGNGELDMENPYEESDVSFDLGFQLGTLMNARIEMRISEPDREGYTRYYLSDVTDDMSDLRTKIYCDNIGLQANMNGNVNPDGYEPFQQPFTFSVYMSEDTDNPGMYKPTMEVESTGTFYGESTYDMQLGSMMHNAMVFKNTMGGSNTGTRGSMIGYIKITDKDNTDIVYHNFVPVLHEGVPCFKDEMTGQYFYTSGVEEPTYEEAQEDGPANNEIWYDATSKIILNIPEEYEYGSGVAYDADGNEISVIAHTFENGRGIITFSGDVHTLGDADVNGSPISFYAGDDDDHDNLTAWYFPSTLRVLNAEALWGWYACELYSGLENVTTYNDGAMSGSGIKSFEIPGDWTEIKNKMFHWCGALESINIPDAITSIGEQAFQDCTSITEMTIPSDVAAIGISAFAGCTSLSSVTIYATVPPTLGDTFVFENCPLAAIYVPAESVADYQAADGWSDYASLIQGI